MRNVHGNVKLPFGVREKAYVDGQLKNDCPTKLCEKATAENTSVTIAKNTIREIWSAKNLPDYAPS
jgi:hypothetical protein